MSFSPENPMLDRGAAATYVASYGLPMSPKTLAKLASIGGGPIFHRFGRRVCYSRDSLDDWIKAKLSPPMASTSDI